ncbi:MAG: DUF1385 domain-containing protein [Clostridia bacterium]|nr:DUF1385 domain-containing protein [Clostridia bacterium]
MAKYTAIGGQALIEGIMMRSPEKTALAVRTPEKEIDITYMNQKSIRERYKILKLPILRGVAGFVESLIQGYKAMMLSAEKSGYTDIDAEQEEKIDDKKKNTLVNTVMVIGTVLGVVLAVVLFMLLPRLAVAGLQKLFGSEFSKLLRSVIEQVIKLCVFVLYVWSVSLMKDIKRVFMYHGAEHKTIFCYESGQALTVENVRKQKRFHPRCGTSFMIIMILISIVFSTLIQAIFPGVYNIYWLWVVAKILMIPLVCGFGFELLRVTGKYDNIATRIISAPGLWLQRITTKEPEDDMIEIAIAALKACEPKQPDVDRSVDAITQEREDGNDDDIRGL